MRSSSLALPATPVPAQVVSLEFTPEPAPPGVPVTITGTNAAFLQYRGLSFTVR